jgi:hypothetical protein
MQLLDEKANRWYCFKDNEVYYANLRLWGRPTCPTCGKHMVMEDEMGERWSCPEHGLQKPVVPRQGDEQPIATQATARCSCKRNQAHIHYSSTHDLFVRLGLLLFLVAEAIAFVQTYVKVTTVVYFPSDVITQYTTLMNEIANVTASYQYVNWLGMGMELLALAFAVTAVGTLHPIERKRTSHEVAIVGSIFSFVISWIFKWYYARLTQSATVQFFGPQSMQTVTQVEEQFSAAQGFWGTATPGAINALCALVYLVLFIGALFTTIHYTVWTPPPAVPSPSAPELTKPVTEPSVKPAASTKFCRFCGAKILRDSEYCEECGKRLSTQRSD